MPRGLPSWKTDGLGVANGTELPVAVDGKVVGTLKLDPRAKGYILSTEPACYRMDLIRYASLKGSSSGVGSSASHFTGGKVAYSLWSGEIDHFLSKAPLSGQAGMGVSQVNREPCAP